MITTNSYANQEIIKLFDYQKYSFLYKEPKFLPKIKIEIPNKNELENINTKIKKYKNKYNKKLCNFFNLLFDSNINCLD